MPEGEIEAPGISNLTPQERIEEIIRVRAYQLFEVRGYEHGHDVDDWLQAEAELAGKKPLTHSDQSTTSHKVAAT